MKKILFCLLIISATSSKAQTNAPILKIDQITIGSTNVTQMAEFYSNVLNITLNKKEEYGMTTYSGNMGDIKIFLYPNQLAPNSMNQNRHQFDFVVSNLSPIVTNALKNGGKIKGEVIITQKQKSAVILDPDGNSIIFRQNLANDTIIGKL